MNNFVINQFNGSKLITVIWNNKPCWIAKQVAELSGQLDPNLSVNKFLENNDFLDISIDYEVLQDIELKRFKELIKETSTSLNTGSLTIFYESALWVYLQSLKTDMSKTLKRLINCDVLPSIRKIEAYISNNIVEGKISTKENKVQAMQIALQSIEMFEKLIDEAGINSNLKLIIATEIFNKMGINIPISANKNQINIKAKGRTKAVDSSEHKETVNQMLINKISYSEISDFLKSKGENISRSSIGRYAKYFFECQNKNISKLITSTQGGNSNE